MSEYGYDDGPRHRGSHRPSHRGPEYAPDPYLDRGPPHRDLVYRSRDHRDNSIEDIPRDFPPPGSDYRSRDSRDSYGPPRRARTTRGGYDDDDYYSDHGYGYGHAPRDRHRSRRDDGYYSDHERPRRERRKSVTDTLKGLGDDLGLGGVVGALAGAQRARSKSRDRHGGRGRGSRDDYYDRRGRYSSSSRSSSRGGRKKNQKWEQAAKAAIVAGAVEAFRSRKEPGAWTGEKGQRIATAALGAAGIDSFADRDHSSKRHVAESALGGLVATRLANGPRDRSSSRGRSMSRSRSRSRARSLVSRSLSRLRGKSGSPDRAREGRSRSRIKEVAGAGAVLAAGKALYDRVRSKSRKRGESRSRSASSEDSFVPTRGRRYDRVKDSDLPSNGGDLAGPMAAGGALATRGRDASVDSESSTDLEKRRKKMRGKELLTAGFATVATIHAAHGVYNSMVASEKRRKLVSEGEMSPEEARKRKSKNMLQDAASVGIAALSIKSTFSEWKEMNEQRHSVHELEQKRQKRRKMKERRDREFRQNLLMNSGANQGGGPYPGPPMMYNDGNPYGASVPPPPMGAPPQGMRY